MPLELQFHSQKQEVTGCYQANEDDGTPQAYF